MRLKHEIFLLFDTLMARQTQLVTNPQLSSTVKPDVTNAYAVQWKHLKLRRRF